MVSEKMNYISIDFLDALRIIILFVTELVCEVHSTDKESQNWNENTLLTKLWIIVYIVLDYSVKLFQHFQHTVWKYEQAF